jgi:hypothetical protein
MCEALGLIPSTTKKKKRKKKKKLLLRARLTLEPSK